MFRHIFVSFKSQGRTQQFFKIVCTAIKANCNIENFPIDKSFAHSQYNFCLYFHRYAKVQLTVLGLASYLGAVFMPEFVHFVVLRTSKLGSKLTSIMN